jgi:hypothetical protein
MLPALNGEGDLPPGVHVATWAEIERRFGSGSGARVGAMATLKHLHELALRTGALKAFYVFGSFASAAPSPRDIDLALVMDADFRLEDCPREARTLFSHADAEARYRASVFWLREGTLDKQAMREFLAAWQTKRDGSVRGILEVA